MNAKAPNRRVGLVALATAAVVCLTGAAPATLNPLVTRAPETRAAVPVECVEGAAPAIEPRIAVRDIPLPEIEPIVAASQVPPSASLRAALQDAQSALADNDRPAFDAAHRRARSLVATYPSGAERRAAEELMRLYDDAARLWDAQFESPFFDETSAEYQAMRAHAGWSEAVRRSTIADPQSGRRFYPAGESRDYLAGVAADRLRGLGLQAPVRVTRSESSSRSETATQQRPRTTTSTRSTTPADARPRATPPRATTGRTLLRKTGVAPGTTRRSPRPRLSSAPAHPRLSTEARTPAPVTTAPGSPDPQASPTTAAAPEPAAPAAGSSEPAPASPAAGGTTTPDAPVTAPGGAPLPTDTAVTSAPGAVDPVPAPVSPSRGRSVVLPAVLILIGLGVLIVLFRASK